MKLLDGTRLFWESVLNVVEQHTILQFIERLVSKTIANFIDVEAAAATLSTVRIADEDDALFNGDTTSTVFSTLANALLAPYHSISS